jgi:hypothetical protein
VTKRRHYAEWECAFLRENYATSLTEHLALVLRREIGSVHQKARALDLEKDPAFLTQVGQALMLDPNHGGRRYQFQPGRVPANKGLKRPGWAPGRMAETQFKPGQRPKTWVPVGSYRVNSDGYLDRKVNDLPGPNTVRWHPVHRLVWMEANGPVPKGHTVVFKPGRRTTVREDITLDAVECITRAQLMARNTIHQMPPELADVARLRGRLTRAINERAKEADDHG